MRSNSPNARQMSEGVKNEIIQGRPNRRLE